MSSSAMSQGQSLGHDRSRRSCAMNRSCKETSAAASAADIDLCQCTCSREARSTSREDRGTSDRAAKLPHMRERVAQALTVRLEQLAQIAERSGAEAPRVARLLEAASVATMHAVALDLLSAPQARAIWRAAIVEHPVLEQAEPKLREAA